MILDKKIPISYLFSAIKWDLLVILFLATVIHLISEYVISITLPIAIAAFLGTAISLVLSFKISQSYDRWWEARKIWGAIVNDSRSLVIQLIHFLDPSEDQASIQSIAFRQIAWCYSLGQNLRKLNPLEHLERFLPSHELDSLKHQKNVPLSLVRNQTQDLKTLYLQQKLTDFQQIQLDSTLVRLCASMGMAERIKSTVFPKTYRLTLHFFIIIFLTILSLSLTDLSIFIEIPLLTMISIPFFLLEKIALVMQDPFENKPTDTSMTAIATTIETNIKQLLDQQDLPEAIKSDTFYVM